MQTTSKNLVTMYADYLQQHRTLALATADNDGRVNCATVYYARDDSGRLFFGCSTVTRKTQSLKANQRVAATIDDDGKGAMGVQIRGRADQLSKADHAHAKATLIARHPQAAGFYENPDLTFFELHAEECYLINFAWGIDWRQRVV